MYTIFLQKQKGNKHILENKYWQVIIFKGKKHITITNKEKNKLNKILNKIFNEQKDFALINNKIEFDIITQRKYWDKTIDFNILSWLLNKKYQYSEKYNKILSFYKNNEMLILPNILLSEMYNLNKNLDLLEKIYNTNIFFNLHVPFVLSYLNQHQFVIDLFALSNNLTLKRENDDKNTIYLYNNYKPFTKTLRPTNNNQGFNFMALDKIKRKSIKLNKPIIEIDFSAFHIQLLASIVDEKLPNEYNNWHKYLHEKYFKKNNMDYNTFKTFVFNILYSDKIEKYTHIPLFNKIYDLKTEILWNYDGMIITNKIVNCFDKTGENLNEKQIFNYYLQQLEVETVFTILFDLINHGVNIIFYLYDSFYFEYNSEDELEFIKKYLKKYQYKIKKYEKTMFE